MTTKFLSVEDRFRLLGIILKGIGQIMLQDNRLTGLFFLCGLFLGSIECGFAAILASFTGSLTAIILKFGRKEIDAGMYGFSAALVGVALTFLFKAEWLIWALILIGSISASLIQHAFIKIKFPAYTFPFILVTWIIVFFLQQFTHIPPSELFLAKIDPEPYSYLFTGIDGFGQVIFQAGIYSGAIFFLGVFVSSPAAALYGLAASLIGAFLSQLNGQPLDNIYLGLFGFNAVLSAIVFSGFRKKDGCWVLIATLLTVWINIFLVRYHLLDRFGGVFTFPFVAGTWATLLIQKIIFKRQTLYHKK